MKRLLDQRDGRALARGRGGVRPGAPSVRLGGRYATRAERIGVTHIHLSLTHGDHSAVAVAERLPPDAA